MSQTDALVLVVDDDARLRGLLQKYLAEHGFRVSAAEDGAAARDRLRFLDPDLLVLDVMMPGEAGDGEGGLELTRWLRGARAAEGRPVPPILLLTARGAPDDRVAGFEAGADDYLAKPFDPRELLLRLRAMLRRVATPPLPPAPPSAGPLALGVLRFDVLRAELSGPRGPVRLTGGEGALLGLLAARAGDVCTREDIAAGLGMDEATERAIDVQVTRLRRKIEPDPREPRYLHTVRGRGYVLKPG